MASNSKFIEDLLDLDIYKPHEAKPGPTLKLVFDNLRCYPLLAVIGLGIGYLSRSDGLFPQIAAWALLPVFVILFLGLLCQSSFMFGCLTLGMFGVTIQPAAPRTTPLTRRQKLIERVATVLAIAFFVVFFIAATNLLGATIEFIKRANL